MPVKPAEKTNPTAEELAEMPATTAEAENADEGEARGKRKQKPRDDESDVDAVANLIGTVGRITILLQRAIGDSGVGISGWILMRSLQREETRSTADAARRLGVSRQRVHQQMVELKAAGLINMPNKGEKSARSTLSPRGAEVVQDIETKLMELMAQEEGPIKALRGARRMTAKLLKALSSKAKKQNEPEEGETAAGSDSDDEME